MKSSFRVPYLSDAQIARKAKDFLQKYNPDSTVPVPIENIVEFDLCMNIIPIPGLHRTFEIDGFSSSDFAEISVDLGFFENVPKRFRFTLAHEIGHLVMHKGLLSSYRFNNAKEWLVFMESIASKEYGFLETQANKFAGFLLVPVNVLNDRLEKARKIVEKLGIDFKEMTDVAWYFIYEELSSFFQVSTECIKIRIEMEKLK